MVAVIGRFKEVEVMCQWASRIDLALLIPSDRIEHRSITTYAVQTRVHRGPSACIWCWWVVHHHVFTSLSVERAIKANLGDPGVAKLAIQTEVRVAQSLCHAASWLQSNISCGNPWPEVIEHTQTRLQPDCGADHTHRCFSTPPGLPRMTRCL